MSALQWAWQAAHHCVGAGLAPRVANPEVRWCCVGLFKLHKFSTLVKQQAEITAVRTELAKRRMIIRSDLAALLVLAFVAAAIVGHWL
jgi:hypothetical protein